MEDSRRASSYHPCGYSGIGGGGTGMGLVEALGQIWADFESFALLNLDEF